MRRLRKRILVVACIVALTVQTVGATPVMAGEKDKYEPWSVEWFKHHPRPVDRYWDRVAECETNSNWSDGGKWGGGLGIAITTWQRYGGGAFSRHPSGATREEQIKIANRIAVRGYIRKDGSFQFPAGYGGWGCIRMNKYLKPHPSVLWYKWKWS